MASLLRGLAWFALGVVIALAWRVVQVWRIERSLDDRTIDKRERDAFFERAARGREGAIYTVPGLRVINPDARRLSRRVLVHSLALGRYGLRSIRRRLGPF